MIEDVCLAVHLSATARCPAPTRSRNRHPWAGCALAGLALLAGCEGSPATVSVDVPADAALAPVVLVPPPQPPGIGRFDCTTTQPGASASSLRNWGATGPAGAALHLKGQALACEVTLRSDCTGQAELRVAAGLARSEKVVTAVAPTREVTVQLRLPKGDWERALEPAEGLPYQHTLQLVARAQVRCAGAAEPRPRYWTDSFIAGLAGTERASTTGEPGTPEAAAEEEGSADPGAAGEGPAKSERPATKRVRSDVSKGDLTASDSAEGASPIEGAAKGESAAQSEDVAKSQDAAKTDRAARRERKRSAASDE